MNSAQPLPAKCRPLTDAVQLSLRFLLWQMLAIPFTMAVASLVFATFGDHGILHWSAKEWGSAIESLLFYTAIILVPSLPMMAAFRLLLRELAARPKRCLLLRAFRSDQYGDKMRAWLKASLGAGYKLSGIRPPGERASAFSSFLSPLSTGLRYAGSRQFELEAPDHNWMARLLATFAESRFVFIDVRDVTVHVLDEISLAWQVFGVEKCIFIVDALKGPPAINSSSPAPDPDTSWRQWLARQLHDTRAGAAPEPASFKLLAWPSDSAAEATPFRESVHQLLRTIPVADVVISPEHIAFVQQRIPADQWNIRFWEKETVLLATSMIGMGLLNSAWAVLCPQLPYLPGGMLFIALQVLYWRSWNRSRHQRRLAIRINPAGPPSRGRLWASAACMVFYLAIWIAFIVITLRAPMFSGREAIRNVAGERQGTGGGRD